MSYKKRAGESTRDMARARQRTTNLILFGMLILAIILALVVQNWRTIGLSGGAVFALVILIRILPDLAETTLKQRTKVERRAERGAKA